MDANKHLLKALYLPICCWLLVMYTAHAQPGRWQWGVGTSVHLSTPELSTASVAAAPSGLRPGLSALARYRLNRKANWQWGPFRNQLNLFWETGLRIEGMGYAYQAGKEHISRDYLCLEAPVKLVMVSDVRSFPGWRKRRMHGYGRLGGSIGVILPQKIDEMAGGLRETTNIGGLRAGFHLSSGLLQKRKTGGHSSVGIFARIGFTPVVRGQITAPQAEPPLRFRSTGSLFGLEWAYFFGRPHSGRSRLPEKPVDMILCPQL